MCVSYHVPQNSRRLYEGLKARQLKAPRFGERVFPRSPAPVIIQENNARLITEMEFSLIPWWSEVRNPKFATYNARLESQDEKTGKKTLIFQKRTWRDPFTQRHCLIPMEKFYESVYEGPHKGNIIGFSAEGQEYITAAGIWDSWTDKTTGEVIESFSVLTDNPYPFIKEMGHDRSPIFLEDKSFDEWLNPKGKSPEKYLEFLRQRRIDYKWTTAIDRPLKAGWEKRA